MPRRDVERLTLRLVPLLAVQRELYDVPRGWGRFQAYLDTMLDEHGELRFPLPLVNPMGKIHVGEHLDALLELGAEEIAGRALVEAEERLKGESGTYKVALVLADDAAGGWTDRQFTDAQYRFEGTYAINRGWIVCLLWTSDSVSHDIVRRSVLSAIARTLHMKHYGAARSLGDMMRQEGVAAAFAGVEPSMRHEEIERARSIIDGYRDSTAFPTAFACLYGDEAARAAGYAAVGLSANAGFEVALAEAQLK